MKKLKKDVGVEETIEKKKGETKTQKKVVKKVESSSSEDSSSSESEEEQKVYLDNSYKIVPFLWLNVCFIICIN